jgi:hypothetical protein
MAIKMESLPIEEVEAEAIIPMEIVSNDSAAKRTHPWDLAAGELHLMSSQPPPTPQPQDEDIPAVAIKKPRLEEPLPTTTDEAARETAPHDVSFSCSC